MASTTDYTYSLSFEGKFVSIRFPIESINDSIFRTENLSVLKINSTQFVLKDSENSLRLTYTNDTENVFGNIDSYLNNIITRIKEQETIVTSGVDVVSNQISTLSVANKFGRNPEIDINSVPEDIWHGGSEYTGQPTPGTPETVEVFSSSTLDTAAGTGARTIRFFGLATNASTSYITEDITLNGTTPVATTTTWYRINRAYVLTAGTTGANQGDITIRHTTTTANVFAVMPALANQTAICAYTVPFGKVGYIKQVSANIVRASGAAGSASLSLRVRDTLNGGVFRTLQRFDIQAGAGFITTFEYPLDVPEGADIKFRIDTVSDNDTIASATFTIIELVS